MYTEELLLQAIRLTEGYPAVQLPLKEAKSVGWVSAEVSSFISLAKLWAGQPDVDSIRYAELAQCINKELGEIFLTGTAADAVHFTYPATGYGVYNSRNVNHDVLFDAHGVFSLELSLIEIEEGDFLFQGLNLHTPTGVYAFPCDSGAVVFEQAEVRMFTRQLAPNFWATIRIDGYDTRVFLGEVAGDPNVYTFV